MLKVINVDDEELASERLSRLLLETGEVEILNTFLEAETALQFIKENQVDVAFLDISLPGMDGLMLADRMMDIDSNIDVVFVTGYDEYAIRAFELEAVDYLLKPVTVERLEKTIKKLVKNKKQKPEYKSAKILCLGGFDIYLGDEPQNIKWRTSKTEELLAFLIQHGGKSVSRDYVIERLWEGIEILKAMDNLNTTTYYLRKTLNSLGMHDCIKTNKSGIWIENRKINCDLYGFEEIIKENPVVNSANISYIEKAIEMYNGDYLKNKDYIWAFNKKLEMEKNYIKSLIKIAEYYYIAGMTTFAIESLKKVIALEPFYEEIHEKIIRLYMSIGNRREAEKHYEILKLILAEELGIEPNSEIRRLMGS